MLDPKEDESRKRQFAHEYDKRKCKISSHIFRKLEALIALKRVAYENEKQLKAGEDFVLVDKSELEDMMKNAKFDINLEIAL